MEIKKRATPVGATQTQHINDSTKDRLLSMLTKEPIDKEHLARRLNCTEREIRRVVQELRNDGYAICSSSHRKGYWIGNDIERQQLIKEYKSRAKQMLKTANALDEKMEGQVSIYELV